MRKYLIMSLFLLSACAVKEQPEGMEFSLEMPSAESGKVVIGQKTGEAYPLLWAKGDQIRVNGVLSAALSQAKAGGRSASFTLAGSVSAPYTVVHPASAWTSASLINFPAGSTAVLAAKSNNNTDVQLYNLTAYLRLRITRTDETPSFTKITFEGNGGEPVSGTFNVSYDAEGRPQLGEATQGQAKLTLQNPGDGGEYLLSLPAQTFAQGFTVRIFDSENRYMRLRTTASVTFSPGVITNAPAAAYTPNGMLLDGETPGGLDEGDTPVLRYIHLITELDPGPAVLNSHAGYELESVLQPMYDHYQVLDNLWLLKGINIDVHRDQRAAMYPRIRHLPDGSFIMFYMGGHYGSRIWCTRSADFKTWSEPELLYKPYSVTGESGQTGTRRFVNPDALVLPNGELLLVVAYRSPGLAETDDRSSLSFRRSSDGGKTWGEPYEVRVGTHIWEPCLTLLPDGSIQCYFTDALAATRNSGTGLIVSTDGGYTWSPKIRCCQQYKYDYYTAHAEKTQYNGQKIYTDQMPAFRVLNDGHTLAGLVEGRQETPRPADCDDEDTYNSYCSLSLLRNPSLVWTDLTSYDVVKEGPSDRTKLISRLAYAPCLETFPSGEIVASWTGGHRTRAEGLKLRLRLGNASATGFAGDGWASTDSGVYSPFADNGLWAGIETWGQRFLAMGCMAETVGTVDTLGIEIGQMYLNQRLFAAHHSVTPDADLSDWNPGGAFYVCAPSGEQAVLRVCHDASRLYLALECVDPALAADTEVHLRLALGSTQKLALTFTPQGVTGSDALTQALYTGCTADGRSGYACELSLPLSALGATASSELRCYLDIAVGGSVWPLSRAVASQTQNWQRISLLDH